MKDSTNPAWTAEQQAVEDVITQEINAFFTRDFDAWAACYLHSDRLRSTMMSHDLGLDIREGWDAHVAGTRLHFDTSGPTDAHWDKITEQITVQGDMAWLTCRARTDTSLCMMGESYETWVLERHDGAWKVVCVNVMAVRSHMSEHGRIAVDAGGKVVGVGASAEQMLKARPGFAIRQGRLRAVDAGVDTALQAAFAQAGQLHGYFEQAAYADMEGQRFATPLVLDRADGEGHEVVLITVQDRMTYVDFGTSEATRVRTDASGLIFGLSDSQLKVAQGVVAGDALPAIARQMGISPATAKTHLQRIYDKTGTTTMTALVRTLLSVG